MAADGTAERLSAYVHVLRSLVHANLGLLPAEPRLDAKRALGRHAYEDARSIDEILTRLRDLPGTEDLPGRPRTPLPPADSVDRVYGAVKPALAEALREHERAIDPLTDQPTLEVVVAARARTERHLDELPHHDRVPIDLDLRVEPGTPPDLRAQPGPEQPAREAWLGQGANTDMLQHAVSAELAAAEILARTSHESTHLPWAFHSDVARLVADRLRHVAALEAELTHAGAVWGEDTINAATHQRAAEAPVAQKLEIAHDLARTAADEHPPLRDDLTPFARIAERWQ